MVVMYRLAGVDGEATEDKVEFADLDDPEALSTANLSPIGCDVLGTSDHFVLVPMWLVTCPWSLVPVVTCPHFRAISGFLLLLATNTNNYLLYTMIMSQYLSLKLIFLLSCLVKLTRLRSYT